FKQCCEKGTRERKLEPPALLVNRHSGSTIETIHEVRLKQFCARFDGWVEQASQPREELRRAAGIHHASGSLFFVEPIPALGIVPLRKTPKNHFRNVPSYRLAPHRRGLFLSELPADSIVLRQHHTQPFSFEDEERARIQPKAERTLAFLMAFGGTTWAKTWFCSHVGSRS